MDRLKQHLVLNSALLATWVTLKAEIDNVRRAQAAASSTPQPMDLSAYGAQELDSFQKGKSRGKGKAKGKDKGKPKDNVPTPCPICGKAGHWKKDCCYNIPGGWEDNKPNAKTARTRRVRSAEIATARDTIPKIVRRRNRACRLWRVRQARGFFLNAFEEETELNSFESKVASVLVTGIDSGAARSVVPAGEIPGCSVERDSETGRVHTSVTGERVFDQEKQQILGTVDGKVRGLNMRVAQVKKSLMSVYDMCAAGHRVVLDFDSNKRDLSHAENKLTGERTCFKLRTVCGSSKSTSFRKRKPRTS